MRYYDLGGIDPEGNPGVYHFKSGLGGREVTAPGPFEAAPSRARKRFVETAEAVYRKARGARAVSRGDGARKAGGALASVLCFGGEDWWYHNHGHIDMQLMKRLRVDGARPLRQLRRHAQVQRRRRPHVPCACRAQGEEHLSRRHGGRAELPRIQPRVASRAPCDGARELNESVVRTQVTMTMARRGIERPLVWVACPAACDVALKIPTAQASSTSAPTGIEDYPGVDREQIVRYDLALKARPT